MKYRFSLIAHPWLFLLAFMLAILASNILISNFLIFAVKLPISAPTFSFWLNALNNSLIVFILVPFVLRFPGRPHSYADYLSEIRLTRWQPVLKLLLLGITCWLILGFCQVICTLAYRLSQGGAIDLAFLRNAFPLGSEFPPQSSGWLISTISIFEEIAYRGVILAVFLRIYDPAKAVLYSAIGFGAMHILSWLGGADPIWAVGNVVWAALLGIFYGFVTYKTGSLLPAMLVHYLGNLFIYPLTAYVQNNAPILVVVLFGITLTMGAVPVLLMGLWTRYFTSRWPMTREIPSEKIQVSEPYLGH